MTFDIYRKAAKPDIQHYPEIISRLSFPNLRAVSHYPENLDFLVEINSLDPQTILRAKTKSFFEYHPSLTELGVQTLASQHIRLLFHLSFSYGCPTYS
jgi:hypothetical protein